MVLRICKGVVKPKHLRATGLVIPLLPGSLSKLLKESGSVPSHVPTTGYVSPITAATTIRCNHLFTGLFSALHPRPALALMGRDASTVRNIEGS